MDVSRVSVSQQTLKQYGKLSRKRKRKLRDEAIKALITSKPNGYRFSHTDFQRVGNFNTYSAAALFVKNMVRDGKLIQTGRGEYFLPAEDKAVRKEAIEPQQATYTVKQLEKVAMQYVWEQNAPHDMRAIQQFIKHLKKEQ